MGKKKKAIMKGWKKFANHPAVKARQKPEEAVEEQKAPTPPPAPGPKVEVPKPAPKPPVVKKEAPRASPKKVQPWLKNKK